MEEFWKSLLYIFFFWSVYFHSFLCCTTQVGFSLVTNWYSFSECSGKKQNSSSVNDHKSSRACCISITMFDYGFNVLFLKRCVSFNARYNWMLPCHGLATCLALYNPHDNGWMDVTECTPSSKVLMFVWSIRNSKVKFTMFLGKHWGSMEWIHWSNFPSLFLLLNH